MKELDVVNVVDSYISEKDWRVKENANRAKGVAGLKGFVAERVLAEYMLEKVYGEEAKRAHYYGDLHIHDLSMPSFYCNSYSVDKIVMNGLRGIPGVVESVPPRHFSSAMGQVVNFVMMIQQEQAGAVGLNCLDTYLAPFVRWDKLDYKQVRQIVQEFIYTVNLPFRSGLESCFVNVTFDAALRDDLKDEHVIACGEIKSETYGDFEEEVRTIDKAFMDVMYQGDAKGRIFTFPIVTVNVTEHLDWETEFGRWLARITSKYGTPYFQNMISTDMTPDMVRSFCCLHPNERVFVASKDLKHVRYVTLRRLFMKAGSKTKLSEDVEVVDEPIYVLYKGKFVAAKLWRRKFKHGEKMLQVILDNGLSFVVTDDHICVTREGLKTAGELTTDDEIPVSLIGFNVSDRGGEELGEIVGMYLAGGRCEDGKMIIRTSPDVADWLSWMLRRYFGCYAPVEYVDYTAVAEVMIYERHMMDLLSLFVRGKDAGRLRLRSKVFSMSNEFREGILSGIRYVCGVGEKKYDILVESKELADDICSLAHSLGLLPELVAVGGRWKIHLVAADVMVDLDGNEVRVEARDIEYIKIKSIKEIDTRAGYVYDFEIIDEDDEESLFELANGVITHNCRLRGDLSKIKRYGGIFSNPDSVGSVGVVTINLPRIGYLARGDDEKFINTLYEVMLTARQILTKKREFVTRMMEMGMYPMFKEYVGHLNWMYNTIGLVGMHEALLNMGIGGIVTEDGLNFAEKILKYMVDVVEEFEKEDGVLWNVEQTPAESASGRLKACDIRYLPNYVLSEAIREMGAEIPYTNSTHVPVDYTDNIWWVLRHQEKLNRYYTGGSVVHIFLGERLPEDVVPTLVDRICRKTEIPYFSITPTFSVCPNCGYLEGEQWKCKKCGSNCDVYSRIVGYYSPVQRWNKWKKAEFNVRKKYKV